MAAPEEDKNKLMTDLERAAIFIMSLSADQASKVLSHLGPKQIQRLGLAMAQLKGVEQLQLQSVLNNFLQEAEIHTSIGVNNDEHIRKVMYDALGEDKAGGVIDRILLGANTKGLDTLKWMDSRAVADIIRNEHPQIQTIVLSYLDADQAGEILGFFDERVRLDLMLRISNQESIQPAALQELNVIMEKQFLGNTGGQTRSVGGVKRAADIMNFLDSAVEADLLDGIKDRDPELGQTIQDLMFVFDNLIEVNDRGIQALLREISSEKLILALKGADAALKEKIFANMSKRAAELLRDDLEAKGPVKVSDVETAQKEILAIARRMSDAGEIVLGGKGVEQMI
jgi:flagellar motor switch protein FliG